MHKDWKMLSEEIVDNADCYNLGHFLQKVNVDWEISHIYNRKAPMFLYGFNSIVNAVLDTKIEMDDVERAHSNATAMGLPFPIDMWISIVNDFNGRMPLRVRALPDGKWVPKGTPYASIENTEEGFGELVTWFEQRLLKSAFPSGVATRSYYISEYLKEKNLPNDRIHSFALRSYNSEEDSIWGSTAWNLFMTGTDDFHSKKYTPSAKIKSIMASAHKVMQQFDVEYDGVQRQIDAAVIAKKNIVSFPIDTYDAWNFIKTYVEPIAKYAKDKGVHVVLRPDSGDVMKQGIAIYKFVKEKGIDNVTVIIGEGIDFEIIKEYDFMLEELGIPLDFFVYGIGGGLHRDIGRDTHGLAMKTSFSNGKDRMKLVKSDPFKQSLPGDVSLFREDGKMVVDYGRDSSDNHEALYVDIYHFNARSDRQETYKQTWEEVYWNIRGEISMGYTKQKDIVLNPLVLSNIQKFKDQYTVK